MSQVAAADSVSESEQLESVVGEAIAAHDGEICHPDIDPYATGVGDEGLTGVRERSPARPLQVLQQVAAAIGAFQLGINS
jgi:hypothetical protein